MKKRSRSRKLLTQFASVCGSTACNVNQGRDLSRKAIRTARLAVFLTKHAFVMNTASRLARQCALARVDNS
eukprot:9472764-Pyramimonas_sp.AAC.1